jgi:hypothetical protein
VRRRGGIDEPRLGLLPIVGKPILFVASKAANIQFPHAFLAFAQRSFGFALITVLIDGAFVFRAQIVRTNFPIAAAGNKKTPRPR